MIKNVTIDCDNYEEFHSLQDNLSATQKGLIECLMGCFLEPNDDTSRDLVFRNFSGFKDINRVVCSRNNNPPEIIDLNKLRVDFFDPKDQLWSAVMAPGEHILGPPRVFFTEQSL